MIMLIIISKDNNDFLSEKNINNEYGNISKKTIMIKYGDGANFLEN